MRVHILGARGSTPAPGPEFVRYGGHTSCLAIAHDGARPTLVIDAGTGIRRLSAVLGGEPFRGSIIVGHFHWDHTQGLPFFESGLSPGAVASFLAPDQGPGGDVESVLTRAMSPPHFPITPAQMPGKWRFDAIQPGEHEIEGFSVLALEIPHKGGRTFGYRVSDGKAVLAYMSDHWPLSLGPGPDGLGEYHEAAVALAWGADVLFHDAQYSDEELPTRAHFGHSSPGYALKLAEKAGAGKVFLFHYDPWRTDQQIDAMRAVYADTAIPVEGAVEGMVLDLPGGPA